MIVMLPQYEDHSTFMNNNMFDLEDLFKLIMSTLDSAVQHLFKKVFPVLLSGLSYNDLEVQNGTMALEV